LRILLTKAKNNLEILENNFVKNGHTIFCLPVLNALEVKSVVLDFSDYQNVIFTSSHSIQFLKNKKNIDHLKCYCVGQATSKAAKNFGFKNIVSCGGNYTSLKNTFVNLENQKSVKTIYIRGEFISNDLVKEFKQEGYLVNEIINYTTELNHSFEDEIKKILLNQSIDIIFLYSKRASDFLLKIILNHQLASACEKIKLRTLSENVFFPLKKIKWQNIKIFEPGHEEFCLD